MIADIILAEESVEGSQSDQLEPKILIDDNGQHYKIEMPPETESEIQGKIESGNFYKMNYVDGATIWVSESNLNAWMLVVKLEFFLINEWETVICILFDHTSKWPPQLAATSFHFLYFLRPFNEAPINGNGLTQYCAAIQCISSGTSLFVRFVFD